MANHPLTHTTMSKQTVLLLGATGETGGSILAGLLENPNSFVIIPSSPTR